MAIKQLVTLIRNIYIPNNSRCRDQAWAVKKEQLFTDSLSLQGRKGDGVCVHSDLSASPRDALYLVILDFSVVQWSVWRHSVQQVMGSIPQYQKGTTNLARGQEYLIFLSSTFRTKGNKWIIKIVTPTGNCIFLFELQSQQACHLLFV